MFFLSEGRQNGGMKTSKLQSVALKEVSLGPWSPLFLPSSWKGRKCRWEMDWRQ